MWVYTPVMANVQFRIHILNKVAPSYGGGERVCVVILTKWMRRSKSQRLSDREVCASGNTWGVRTSNITESHSCICYNLHFLRLHKCKIWTHTIWCSWCNDLPTWCATQAFRDYDIITSGSTVLTYWQCITRNTHYGIQ